MSRNNPRPSHGLELARRYEEEGVREFSPQEWKQLHQHYIDLVQLKKAETVAKAAAFFYSDEPSVRLLLPMTHLETEQYTLAMDEVNALIDRSASEPDFGMYTQWFCALKGLILLKQHDRLEADRLVHGYLSEHSDPENEAKTLDLWDFFIDTLLDYGEAEEALRLTEGALCLFAGDREFVRKRAESMAMLKRYEESAADYRQVVKEDPFDGESWLDLGLVYFSNSKFKEAADALEYAAAIDPENPTTLETLANAYYQSDQFKKALERFSAYTRQFGTNTPMLLSAADCFMRLDEFKQAKMFFKTLMKAEPENGEVLTGFGYCLLCCEEYKQALGILKKAVKFAGGEADAWLYLGDAYCGLERSEEALQAYLESFKLDPKQADLCLKIGLMLFDIEAYSEALDFYNEAARLDPELDDLDLMIAMAHYALHNYPEFNHYFAQAAGKNEKAYRILTEWDPEAGKHIDPLT